MELDEGRGGEDLREMEEGKHQNIFSEKIIFNKKGKIKIKNLLLRKNV